RGERIPDAVFNLRTPIVRIPLWLALTGWTLRGLVRLLVFYVRYWYVTVPGTGLGWLWWRYDWPGPVAALAAVVLLSGAWVLLHRVWSLRMGYYPAVGKWRRLAYRRRWYAAMATARLAVTFDRRVVLPELRRVRVRSGVDVLTVRLVTGQIPDDVAAVSERLA